MCDSVVLVPFSVFGVSMIFCNISDSDNRFHFLSFFFFFLLEFRIFFVFSLSLFCIFPLKEVIKGSFNFHSSWDLLRRIILDSYDDVFSLDQYRLDDFENGCRF